MTDGAYQRTCNKCQGQWLVPVDFAEERPNVKDLANQFLSLAGGGFGEQAKMRAHFQQLAAFAKCPQCGATSFTQQKVAGSAGSTESAESPASPASPESPESPDEVPAEQLQTYVLNQKLVSLTGDSWIEDIHGNHAFDVDGQLLSLRGTHVLKDLGGQALYEISKPLAPHLHKTIEIRKAGQTVATVQEALFNLGGDKFTITVAAGQVLTVRGDWMNREFQVTDPSGQVVITASRAWFTIHDAYGIQITAGFDVPLGLAIAVALERVEAQEQGGQSPLQNLLGGIGPF
ncbi:MAG: LURP-one-related/scramblase family protein [Acidimicrobiales bacterium]